MTLCGWDKLRLAARGLHVVRHATVRSGRGWLGPVVAGAMGGGRRLGAF